MANPVLPYPNLDFVPLDILTAAEQNMLVANINYLSTFSAGLADGSNLSNGIILPRHFSSDFNYSTTEQKTGWKYKGKDIYCKVIENLTYTAGQRIDVAHNIPVDTPISFKGITATNTTFPFTSASNTNLGGRLNRTVTSIFADTAIGSGTATVIIEYTKN